MPFPEGAMIGFNRVPPGCDKDLCAESKERFRDARRRFVTRCFTDELVVSARNRQPVI